MENNNSAAVSAYLLSLQENICSALAAEDGEQHFATDTWQREGNNGGGITRLLVDGAAIEQGGVNFSHIKGDSLPASATAQRPELTGRHYEAMGISLVIHPHNPYAPTTHANVRFFIAYKEGADPIWWFGGGFDLTPYYGFEEDACHWHQIAQQACEPFGPEVHPRLKKWCDDYFYLKHRDEQRGIGGLFFDDLNAGGFEHCFCLMKSIGNHFIKAYQPILARRKEHPFNDRERDFQLYRRGRYVEFNLIYDRGTLFGLQSGGRTESILMSLPPLVKWRYNWHPQTGSPEEKLYRVFLKPTDWLRYKNTGSIKEPTINPV